MILESLRDDDVVTTEDMIAMLGGPGKCSRPTALARMRDAGAIKTGSGRTCKLVATGARVKAYFKAFQPPSEVELATAAHAAAVGRADQVGRLIGDIEKEERAAGPARAAYETDLKAYELSEVMGDEDLGEPPSPPASRAHQLPMLRQELARLKGTPSQPGEIYFRECELNRASANAIVQRLITLMVQIEQRAERVRLELLPLAHQRQVLSHQLSELQRQLLEAQGRTGKSFELASADVGAQSEQQPGALLNVQAGGRQGYDRQLVSESLVLEWKR